MKQKMPRPFIISAICLLILVTGLGLIYIMQKQSPTTIGQIPEKPPEGIGASSLTNLCSHYRIDPDLVIKPLSFKGIALDPDIPLEKVADNNDLTLGAIYDMIREAALGQKL
jgi:hypothetical protein